MSDARGAFDGHLAFGARPALIVVDVVRAYVDPASPLCAPAFVAALPIIARLVEAARARGVPVIFTNVVYQQGGADGGLFYRKVPALRVFDQGSALGAFPAELGPTPDEIVVTKQYASAFFGTSLAATLHTMGVDTAILCGYSTSGCVRASALDALQNGFRPFVASDACADRTPAPHDANLFDLQAKYAEVVDSDAIIALLGQPPA
ncbi:isochorismatase family protein [Sphingomonas sp. AR_OL41]|jgi:maleamate amidohydrolase|uniref:isochorismatase family protein n=1 Tax=Sphingomonas sp. AR_OL41 TaxID=3042729 RepID=UPI002480B516|nr:isochorismatase family protein [Sphingomonas sp. AR_OL41]MDH7972423.1 isochorismatase family protein [Sphingomonas sp. AR_OL41]